MMAVIGLSFERKTLRPFGRPMCYREVPTERYVSSAAALAA